MQRHVNSRFLGLAIFCIAAPYVQWSFAAHPCDVHKVQVQKDGCLKQHAENERNAAEQARKAAQAKEQERQRSAQDAQRRAEQQRQQEQARREAEARRQHAVAEAQKKADAQRRQEIEQREAEARKQQAIIEAQKKAEARSQVEAKRRDDEMRARRETEKLREQELQKKAAIDREKKLEADLRLKRERDAQTQTVSSPHTGTAKTLTAATPGATSVSAGQSRESRQLVCDISAAPKVGDDQNISRCSVPPSTSTIAGAACTCYSNATAKNYGGVAREIGAMQPTRAAEAGAVPKTPALPPSPVAVMAANPQQPGATSNSSNTEVDMEVKRRVAAQQAALSTPRINQSPTTAQSTVASQSLTSTGSSKAGNTSTSTSNQSAPMADNPAVVASDKRKIDDEVQRRLALQRAGNTPQTTLTNAQSTPMTVQSIQAPPLLNGTSTASAEKLKIDAEVRRRMLEQEANSNEKNQLSSSGSARQKTQPAPATASPIATANVPVKAETQLPKPVVAKPLIENISASAAAMGWVGQPERAYSKGRKPSDKTRGFIPVDFNGDIALTITGKAFGATPGKITFSDAGISPGKISWSDSKIVILPKTASINYEHNSSVAVGVVLPDGTSVSRNISVVGLINTRPWGQCTWEVARTRLSNGLAIPSPRAYAITAAIDRSYIPAKWDAINFSENHVGIIDSTPVITKTILPKGEGTEISYSFSLRDRNADWGENLATNIPMRFVVMQATNGVLSVKEKFSRAGLTATGYYR